MAEIVDDIKVTDENDLLKLMEEDDIKEDDKKETKKEVEKESDSEDEDKDSKEDSEEDTEEKKEEIDEEDLEIKEEKPEDLVDIPFRKKEILAKYPTLEKDFPSLFKGYYREKQYADIFPTLEDAKVANEKIGYLKGFEDKIFSGDISTVLSAVKEHEPESYSKLVDGYLQTLHDTDEKAYVHVVNRTLGDVLNNVYRLADGKKNEELKEAAKMVYETIFGSTDVAPPRTYGNKKENNPEADKLKKDKEDFENRKFESSKSELEGKISNALISSVTNNIDPKDQMSAYVKKNASKECVEKIQESMKEDKRFVAIIDSLWKKAAESNYSSESVLRVRNATLSKARSLLRDTILSVRNDALKGSRENRKVDDEEKTKRLPPGKSTAQSKSGNGKDSKTSYKGGDILSYLSQE